MTLTPAQQSALSRLRRQAERPGRISIPPPAAVHCRGWCESLVTGVNVADAVDRAIAAGWHVPGRRADRAKCPSCRPDPKETP